MKGSLLELLDKWGFVTLQTHLSDRECGKTVSQRDTAPVRIRPLTSGFEAARALIASLDKRTWPRLKA